MAATQGLQRGSSIDPSAQTSWRHGTSLPPPVPAPAPPAPPALPPPALPVVAATGTGWSSLHDAKTPTGPMRPRAIRVAAGIFLRMFSEYLVTPGCQAAALRQVLARPV